MTAGRTAVRWWVLLWLLACCGSGIAGVQRLAAGVYVVQGSVGGVEASNRGAIGNSGFIATPAGTVVVNTGGSYRLGRELLALAQQTTGQPVVAAVITQARPEFLMGAAAFTDRGIEVIAHADTARLIAQRCHVCLRRLQQTLGDDEMAGTRLVEPGRRILGSESIAPGGRRIALLHLGAAQTQGDLVVIDEDSGIAFAGALVTRGRIPELDTVGHAAPWRRALASLATQRVRLLVPGYGAPGPPSPLIEATDRYLGQLEREVQAKLDAGEGLQAAQDEVVMRDWRGWAQHGAFQRRNVQLQYLAAEAAWAAGGAK
ncbi:MBL fold metallo-hydrolase [Piscinibacter sp. XHJ-5]|uniref:MBL fold metallo-hydrolase n=1 Tax=Piscinibacter sp. XHJ-5 TaxID=3037797 RepID=UPI002452B6E0|nr:MBL fold metallo-hydrolase [Piscinibacter sp. XHJ-5]